MSCIHTIPGMYAWSRLVKDDCGHRYVIKEEDVDKFYTQLDDVQEYWSKMYYERGDDAPQFDFEDCRVDDIRFKIWENI